MLSLIEMFSQRPAPIKGGRIVRGYAMSGCKEEKHVPSAINKSLMNEKDVLAALAKYGPMRIVLLSDKSGVPETSTKKTIRRLHERGIVVQTLGKAWALAE